MWGAGHYLEQLAGEMGSRPDAGRSHVDSARIGLGVGDDLAVRRCPADRRRLSRQIAIAARRDCTFAFTPPAHESRLTSCTRWRVFLFTV
jgi:hypothetical protein